MGRKPKPVSAIDDRLKLIEALKFAAIATKDGEGKYAFVAIKDKWLLSENETFTLGVPVDVALDLCPHGEQFQAALQQCGQQFQLTQIETNALSIKSGNFRALVPALDSAALDPLEPDPICATLDDKLSDAFKSCISFMGKGERIYHTSVLLRSRSMVASNGAIAIEYWHGIDLPGPLHIPKKTVETIVKIGKPLAHFGFTASSVTFYFDDMSFIKTRLIGGDWPNFDKLLNSISGQFIPVWPEFFVGLKAISKFVQNDTIIFHSDFLATHNSLELGASYRINGLPGGYVFSAAYWKIIEPFVKSLCIGATKEPFAFSGDNARGLLIGKTQ